jgi:uncharacterized protein YbjT (DUF2867 family)
MKIIITGSLGHTGKPLATELIQNGHAVTVISSNAERQKDIEALGAQAAIGLLEDADFLTSTFAGADAVYAIVPPHFGSTDSRAYYNRVGNNYAQAIQKTDVKRVVHLSSWGADLEEGTGLIVGSHDVEGILDALPTDIAVTHLRAGFIYYNLYLFIEPIKHTGIIASNYGGDDVIIMVAPKDIAAAAAQELQTPATGNNVRYVASDERTADEVARVLGVALGKPDLKWELLTDEQMRDNMQQHGASPHMVAGLVELNAAIHSGIMREGYLHNKPARMGEVKLEDFAREFAAAFEKAS